MISKDVAIVGAGPAGLFAAYLISEFSNLKTIVIEQGADVPERECSSSSRAYCSKCDPCHMLCGIGGAGTLSSGLLNLRPDIGGNLYELVEDPKEALNLVCIIDHIFLKFGAPKKLLIGDPKELEELQRKAASNGVRFIPIPQRLMGTDKSKAVIMKFKQYLEEKGVEFLLKTRVKHIEREKLILSNGEEVHAKYILVAPGRYNASWLSKEAERLGIPTKYTPIDIGVRVEVPAIIMDPVIRIARDPKFHIYTPTYDDFVRTFCVNHRGFVVMEVYKDFVCVNGRSYLEKKTQNTNFAFLVQINLTEPLENTLAYGISVAKQTTVLGGFKPIVQRLGDLRKGRRSTWIRISHSNVIPTLKTVTPGDIAMAMPHRIVTDILEGLDKLDRVIPGVADDSTLLYAPEIKLSVCRLYTDKNLETNVENIFVAGDGAGVSRGLVTAAATGLIAARGILRKEGIDIAFTEEFFKGALSSESCRIISQF